MSRETVITQIENIFETIADAILEDQEMPIQLSDRTICFPGKTPQEARQFTIVLRILELMHAAHVAGVTSTKRDLYYQDPALFGKQAVVDRLVDEIARSFSVTRAQLNVVAAAKGLMSGCFTLRRGGGSIIDGALDRKGCLIPCLGPDDILEIDRARWILVVEKEAVFHSLTASTFWLSLRAQGILITGKGFPDLATRKLLHRLYTLHRPHSPIYGLFDFDPDGLAIYTTYTAGSRTLAHETDVIVPDVRWLGISSAEIGSDEDLHQSQGLLALSSRDRKKAVSMLKWHGGPDAAVGGQWHRELQVMLILGLKAEIQLLDSRVGGLAAWLERRIMT